MNNNKKSLWEQATILSDALLASIIYLLFLTLTNENPSWEEFRSSAVVFALSAFVAIISGGIILFKRNVKKWQIVLLVMKNTAKLCILSWITIAITHLMFLKIWEMMLCYFTIFIASSLFRLTLYTLIVRHRLNSKHSKKVLMVGMRLGNKTLLEEIRQVPALGLEPVGYFEEDQADLNDDTCKYLGKPTEVCEYLSNHPEIKKVFCCLSSDDKEIIYPIIHFCINHMIEYNSVPSISNYYRNKTAINNIGSIPTFSLYESPLSDIRNRFVKRAFDILFSLTFLVTLFPFIAIIVAIVTKITMPGPIFFRQQRNGLNGKVFYCLKFRSMKVNADADRVQATKDDPRKTKWGNILRKTSLDELPQFINVLKGDMSIVGPRPHMQKHTDEYSKLIDMYMMRHLVKPGITGWSQVTGFRGETKELWQMEGRVRGDIWYIEHWTFGLDILIIIKTIVNAISGDEEAY